MCCATELIGSTMKLTYLLRLGLAAALLEATGGCAPVDQHDSNEFRAESDSIQRPIIVDAFARDAGREARANAIESFDRTTDDLVATSQTLGNSHLTRAQRREADIRLTVRRTELRAMFLRFRDAEWPESEFGGEPKTSVPGAPSPG